MLRKARDLRGYAIRATDGPIGGVDDLYFDDTDWAIRYLVADTGGWLVGRKVLISPIAIGHPDWMGQVLPVNLTKAQIQKSPDIDTRKPVSRQHEAAFAVYYGYPYYWGGGGMLGGAAYPSSLADGVSIDEETAAAHATASASADCHLRSCRAVTDYHIRATDGDVGHVADLLVDDETWTIRYLTVETGHWWSGHQVLVAPPWITNVSWSESKVFVGLTRQAIKDAPPYDAARHLDRQQEQGMYEHYGRRGYWTPSAVQDVPKQSSGRSVA